MNPTRAASRSGSLSERPLIAEKSFPEVFKAAWSLSRLCGCPTPSHWKRAVMPRSAGWPIVTKAAPENGISCAKALRSVMWLRSFQSRRLAFAGSLASKSLGRPTVEFPCSTQGGDRQNEWSRSRSISTDRHSSSPKYPRGAPLGAGQTAPTLLWRWHVPINGFNNAPSHVVPLSALGALFVVGDPAKELSFWVSEPEPKTI